MPVRRPHSAPAIALSLALAALVGCGKSTPPPAPPPPPANATPTTSAPDGTASAGNGTAAAPPVAPVKLPSYWVATDIADNWPGKRWTQIDLFKYIQTAPTNLDTGTKYVVFFGRTCDHCEAMFNEDLATNPALAANVTAIEVPAESDRLRGDDPWPLPDTKCTFGQLRLGPNWIMTTPVTVRLENGVVLCAQEGGHKECMGLD